ncbi:MAG: Alpha/beta hydrolase [Aeromicrobium sp.]|jgi:pimeloyl-ACP methyl ester carboxylesterase|nr:Alpha/beta hydrolase [Aeromicrobium sp.]
MTSERLTQYTNGPYTFDVIDSGPLDGIPVVLLHGFPERASCWNAVSEQLHSHGIRTYAPDQRGYSPGARPRSRFAYGAKALTSDTVALIEAIGAGPVHLVAHDLGGIVAWSVAGNHPELASTLTVAAPHPGAFVKSMFTSRQGFKSYYMGMFQVPVLPERVLSSARGRKIMRKGGMTKEMVADYQSGIVEYGALRGGLSWYRSMPRVSPRQFGKKIGVPTTVIWSDQDAFIGRKGPEISERWTTGPFEFQVFEGSNHWVPNQRPAEFAESVLKRIGV